ncbi:MAG: Na+/H+ antiporter subunit C [Saccharospirillum sp.]|nr:Na+/H+ antiporter subunit C [Saccharospirillum sp.]
METLWSIVVGIMLGCGIYLMMERHIVRFIFGLMIVSNAVNLGIFVAGRLTKGHPPLIEEGALQLAEGFANPLPQALILTAIVIGFGLLLFTMILAYRACKELGTADLNEYRKSEETQ